MQVVVRFIFLVGWVWQVHAQQPQFAIDPFQQPLPKPLSNIQFDTATKYNLVNWQKQINDWQLTALDAGYFLFSIALTQQTDSISYFQLRSGPFFEGITLASQAGGTGTFEWIQAKELQKMVQDSLDQLLNNGHPFGQVHLHFRSGTQPFFELQIDEGPEVRWGQLQIKPEGIIQEKVLANLLQLQTGDLFNEAQLLQVQTQLAGQLPFKLLRAPEWVYADQQAELYFFLERIKMSSATGIIGLQPNPANQKTALVGEFNLQLQNTFQKNEKFLLHWRSIAPQTQMLKSSLTWPYIGGSPYGLSSGFTLYRRDTAFLEVKGNLGLTYLFSGNWQVLAQLDYWRSNTLLSAASSTNLRSFSTLAYGIGLQRQQLDFLPNPRKGMQLKALYLVGNKKAEAEQLTWRIELTQRYFVPLSKRQVLCLSQEFDHIQASSLFANELYRFGGLERMRGFDEEAFFASTVVFAGLEYRFLLDEYAHVLVFSDWSWFENKVLNSAQTTVYAVGLGLVLGSDNGQFKLSYGLGAELGKGLQLNAGKLHLGYISYF
ncbi:MAG: BamA/TamA family outer membrane protein [Crocinitomicaceae bacterium]|jgi:outer membrane protein assembly factor BamA|nr:BamA/TamA family outer membrane protein [Crocinitomicaceae bacterium]MDP4723913.1 BamA/TamA family outer membrane protein [Crocinitomicaceae bacterium]MDP4740135.1 BamA/TamA family outer membrane protein [Crocinitomicaceae bacterium]MDP4799979.1 BamA/TamA family outer membrane protein [Crocinitomicaceae bacterium]MDP4868330.1 BamA/TamA family outer membrane protein [Crocinitomicaceae bacterium]